MATLLPQQYAKVLLGLTKNVPEHMLDRVIETFLEYLKKERVTAKLPYILAAYEQYAKKEAGIHEIEITSAHPLSQQVIADIEKIIGGNVETKTAVDEELIGGMVVRTDSTIIDASVKTQLARLKQQME